MKSEESLRNVIEQNECELRVVNWGKLSKTGWLGFFLVSLCLQRQECSFPRFREGTSHLRVLWPISGKESGGGEEKV